MPDKETIKRARKDRKEGKSASTQAGEFVREEIDHVRKGKHGARSTKQAIAIGLSKARRAGVDLPPPEKGQTSERTRKSAKSAYESGRRKPGRKPSAKRSRAVRKALKDEPHRTASKKALSKQARSAARRRPAADRQAAAKKADRTKSPRERHEAAIRAARTRQEHAHA